MITSTKVSDSFNFQHSLRLIIFSDYKWVYLIIGGGGGGGGVATTQFEKLFDNCSFIPLSFCLVNLPSEINFHNSKLHNAFNRATRTVKVEWFCATRAE